MNYELAKQLKEAGFPQLTIPPSKGDYDMHEDDASGATLAYFPTLDELVEACGEKFASLFRKNGGWEANSSFFRLKDGTVTSESWIGDTPQITVAKLWLALQAAQSLSL